MRRATVLAGSGLALALACLLLPVVQAAASASGRRTALTTLAAQAPVLGNTVLLGLSQATLVTALACLGASLQNLDVPGRRLLHLALLLPLVVPPWTMALGLVVLGGNNGLLPRLLGHGPDVYGLAGLVVAGSLQVAPFAYLAMLGAQGGIDQQLLDQARLLGLDERTARRRVVWPRLVPAVVSVALAAFVEAVTDLANPLVLGGGFQVLASRIHLAVSTEYDPAGAAMLALLLAVPAASAYLLARPLGGRGRFRLLQAAMPARRRPVHGRDWWLVAGGLLLATTNVVLVGLVAVGAFLHQPGVLDRPTLAHLAEALAGSSGQALGHSIVLALLALPVTGAVALAVALVARGGPGAGTVRLLSQLLGALPGVLVGLAAFLVVHRIGGSSHRPAVQAASFGWVTAVAVVAVHVVRSLPPVVEALGARLDLAPRAHEDLARLHGASPWQRVRLHHWPLLAPVLGRGMLTSFLRTLTAVSSVVLLANSHVGLLSVQALAEVDAAELGSACAMAVLLAAVGLCAVACCRPVLEED